jgi:hypothetical protein
MQHQTHVRPANKLPAVEAAIAFRFHIAHDWRGTTEAERSASLAHTETKHL